MIVDVPSGLIPVTIANDGVVTTISQDDENWYDYNNKLWANGVLVTESSRSIYLGTTGVEIPENDILAYYVYVPRYKYKILTTRASATGQEQEIEILFENIDVPKSKGTRVGEYLTHPGFTFGSDELNGIWVGKFETGGYALTIKTGNLKSSTYISGDYKVVSSSDKSVAGQKYHYAGTYDGFNLKLYINGVLNKITTASGTIGTPGSNTIMALGTNPSGSSSKSDFYSGKMYMVRIYNRALSEDEIKYNYEMDKEKYPDTLSNDEYVIANLQLQYDGINNAGSTHNSSSTTWQDLSGNGKNGTVNGAIWGDDHLSFDGTDDWVAIGQMNYDKFTLEVVAMTTTDPTSSNSLIGNWHNGGYGLSITSESYARVNGYFANTWIDLETTKKSDINKLYHYVGTYDGTNLKIYQDGVLSNSVTTNGNLITTTKSTIMALRVNPTGSSAEKDFFAGNIYSVRIYNRALTDSEILHNYNIDKNRFNLN